MDEYDTATKTVSKYSKYIQWNAALPTLGSLL
jgi:hypothetical protein